MVGAGREPTPVGRSDPAAFEALEVLLDEAAVWGLELDPRFRVLAATVEPTVERYRWRLRDDRRIQLLCFPVSTLLASLRRDDEVAPQLLSFDEEQLVDVVATLGGATLAPPFFGRAEPLAGEWGPEFSLEGRSPAGDGSSHSIVLHLEQDELRFDLYARFDAVAVKDPDGADLPLP